MGFLGALALTACSSEDVVTPNGSEEFVKGDTHYMAVTIRNANPEGTRAAGDQTGNQSGDLFEEGLSPENEVYSLRLYFFDKDGNGRAVKANGTNFIDLDAEIQDENGKDNLGNPSSEMPNVEKILTAVIAIDTKQGDKVESLKSVVAVVNGDNLPGDVKDNKLVNLSTLREIIGNYGIATEVKDNSGVVLRNVPKAFNNETANSAYPKFLMTSATYGSDNFTCEVEIKPTDLQTSTDDAIAHPVDIYVERAVAKVRMTLDWNDNFKSKVYDGITLKLSDTETVANCTAIKLTDQDNKAYQTADGKDIYVIFRGWGLQSTANKSYMFKKVDSSWNLGWQWSAPADHRSYWALNPTKDDDGFKLENFKHSEATQGKIGTVRQSGSGDTRSNYNGDFFYCQENAADDAASGYKSTYSPSDELTNRTQAYLGGVLVTIDNNVATPLRLAQWGGVTTDITNVSTLMLATVNDQIYTRGKMIKEPWVEEIKDADGNVIKEIHHDAEYEYNSITKDDIELIELEEIEPDITGKQEGKRYISRIQLKKDAYSNKKYYNASYEEISEVVGEGENETITNNAVNEILETAGNAKVWGGGTTYYYVDLTHIGVTAEDNSNYGVVRNHIYDVRVNSVFGLGTPILTPLTGVDSGEEEIIIPEKPKDDDTFLGVQLYILSWRVVDNSTSLEW